MTNKINHHYSPQQTAWMSLSLTWTDHGQRHYPGPYETWPSSTPWLNLFPFPSFLHLASLKLIPSAAVSWVFFWKLLPLLVLCWCPHFFFLGAPRWPASLLFLGTLENSQTLSSFPFLPVPIPLWLISDALYGFGCHYTSNSLITCSRPDVSPEQKSVCPTTARLHHWMSTRHLWLQLCKISSLLFTQISPSSF